MIPLIGLTAKISLIALLALAAFACVQYKLQDKALIYFVLLYLVVMAG